VKHIKESDLTAESVKFAGEYTDKHFKNGSNSEKSLFVTSLAHGYYMGRRHAEKSLKSFWVKLFPSRGSDEWVQSHAIKAGNFYLKKKNFLKFGWTEQALIRAAVSTGFRQGYADSRKS
jgi:hypothetical protein